MQKHLNRIFGFISNLKLNLLIAASVMVLLMTVAPVFSHSKYLQAQAALPIIQAEPQPADRETAEAIRRIQAKAEDVGEARRDIGETGLKNLRKLGENIPETIEFNAKNTRQQGSDGAKNIQDLRREQN